MVKKKRKIKWDWKIALISLFFILWLIAGYSYSNLEEDYREYQQQMKDKIYQMQLDSASDYSNMDCYERGTVDCYEKNSVDCFVKGSVGDAEDDFEEFLRTHDCYERGSAYCYDEPQTTYTCDSGYKLACVKN